MKEQREMQTHMDELNNHIKFQTDEIDRLKAKMRGASAALQTGTLKDIVAAIKILESK
jgi:hypothetical protein